MAVITASPKNFAAMLDMQATANEHLFTMRKLLETAQLTQIATLVETKKIDDDGDRQEKIEAETLETDKQLLVTQKEMLANMKEQAKIRAEEAKAIASLAEGMKTFRSLGDRIGDLKKGFSDKFGSVGALKTTAMKAVNPLGIFNKSIEKEKFIKAQKAINPSMSRDEASKNFKGAYAATKEIKNNETKIAEFKQTTGFSDEQVAKSTEGKKLLASREQSTGELAKYDLRAQSLQEEKTPTAAFASAGEQQEAANEQLKVQGAQADLLTKIEENTRPGGTPTTKAEAGDNGGGGLFGGLGLGLKSLGAGLQGLMTGAGKGIAGFLQGIATGLVSIGKALSSLAGSAGQAIIKFLRGLAIGVSFLANPLTLVGLAAFTLAMMGIGKALEMAAPFMEAFAPVLMKVADVIQNVFVAAIEKIPEVIKGVGDVIMGVIGAISDSIIAIIDAVVSSIERLAAIDGSSLAQTAGGLFAISGAMAAFGAGSAIAGVGNLVSGLLGAVTPGGSAVDQIMKLGESGPNIEKAGIGVEKLASGMKAFSAIDTDKIKAIAALPTDKIAAMGAAMGAAGLVNSKSAENRAAEGQSGGGGGNTSVVAPTINNTTRQTQLIKPPVRNQESSLSSWQRSKYA
jgi:hypothetical protein